MARTNRPVDGVTYEEREAPHTDEPRLLRQERAAAEGVPSQLELMLPTPTPGGSTGLLGALPPLAADSSLDLARSAYRQHLERARRPANTVDSYAYDLLKLGERVGSKPIDRITRSDIAAFLGLANNKSTRKRRLTAVRRFFRYLIDDAKVLTADPTEGFYPHTIQLRTPVPLNADEQAALLAHAGEDEAWSLPAIWLMLRLGLTRGELLALRRDHVDTTNPEQPVVYVFYDEVSRRGKERKLGGDAEFARIYADYLAAREPADVLFPFGFQAVNGMVERVQRNAGIEKAVTPQVLRHTFAVERAKAGASEADLIAVLGLADDARNRASVGRYLKLAAPPL